MDECFNIDLNISENWIYEDQLPEWITDEDYDVMYPFSHVIDGVRMFPIDIVRYCGNRYRLN